MTFAGAFFQQASGKAAWTWTDLDNCSFIQWRCRAGDPPGQVEIEQEMLSQGLARPKTVPGDRFPEWGQLLGLFILTVGNCWRRHGRGRPNALQRQTGERFRCHPATGPAFGKHQTMGQSLPGRAVP